MTVSPGAAIAAGRGLSSARAPEARSRKGIAFTIDRMGALSWGFRHCERSEAIQNWFRGDSLDCFVASLLAMTVILTNYAAIVLVRLSETLSRNPVVESQRWSAPTRSARSLVMLPASTVSTQTFSSVAANFARAALLSSLARCD